MTSWRPSRQRKTFLIGISLVCLGFDPLTRSRLLGLVETCTITGLQSTVESVHQASFAKSQRMSGLAVRSAVYGITLDSPWKPWTDCGFVSREPESSNAVPLIPLLIRKHRHPSDLPSH